MINQRHKESREDEALTLSHAKVNIVRQEFMIVQQGAVCPIGLLVYGSRLPVTSLQHKDI